MIEQLDPNAEYLIATALSEEDRCQKLEELIEMRGRLETAEPRHMSDFERMRVPKDFRDGTPEYYPTLFQTSTGDNILACIYPHTNDHQDGDAELDISYIDKSGGFNPRKAELGFSDDTIAGLENGIPIMSKASAVAAIDRWIGLLSNPLGQASSNETPTSAMRWASDFVTSVATLAKQQGCLEKIIAQMSAEVEGEVPTATAVFPSQRESPNVTFCELNNDYGTDYNCLSPVAAAIYSIALPSIIEVVKTRAGRSNNRTKEPFGLHFRRWRLHGNPFSATPSTVPSLRQLPRMPENAITLTKA